MKVQTIVFVALALAAGSAQAQKKIYKCRNEKGELFYSQSFDPAKCGGGGAQLNDAGVAVKSYERRKTPEEIEADKIKAAEAAEVKRIADAKAHADMVLLQSYPNEEDLTRAHDQQIDAIDGVIRTTQMSVESHERSLAELLAHAAEAERAAKPIPTATAESIESVRQELESQQAAVAAKETERKTSIAEFEIRLARYRELKERQRKHLSGER